MELLDTLLESINKEMRPFAQDIFAVCASCLTDVSSAVLRSAARLTAHALQRFCEPSDLGLAKMVMEPLHRAVARATREQDGETAEAVFGGLAEIVSFAWVVFGDRLANMVQLATGEAHARSGRGLSCPLPALRCQGADWMLTMLTLLDFLSCPPLGVLPSLRPQSAPLRRGCPSPQGRARPFSSQSLR